jgi:hypothetical protein
MGEGVSRPTGRPVARAVGVAQTVLY